MPKLDCVFAGLNVVDVLALLDASFREDEKIRAENIVVDGGGPSATAACAAAACGLKTAALTVIGNDEWRDFALAQFKKFGVDTQLCEFSDNFLNPVSMIFVNRRNASRTIIWNSGGLENFRFHLSAAKLKKIFSARWLHFDGHAMKFSVRLAALVKKKGLKISYDCGSVKLGWEKLAALSDVCIASHKFAAQVGRSPEKTALWLHEKFGVSCAVTCGEKGFYYYDEAKRTAVFVPQRRYKSVDTTGCGDVFHGAFLASYIKGGGFRQSLEFAQKISGIKTLSVGGRRGIRIP